MSNTIIDFKLGLIQSTWLIEATLLFINAHLSHHLSKSFDVRLLQSSPALIPLWRMTKQQTIGATLQSATEWIFIPTMYSTGITILCFFTSHRIFWPACFGNELFGCSKSFRSFMASWYAKPRINNLWRFLFVNFYIYWSNKPGFIGRFLSVSYHLFGVVFDWSFTIRNPWKMMQCSSFLGTFKRKAFMGNKNWPDKKTPFSILSRIKTID